MNGKGILGAGGRLDFRREIADSQSIRLAKDHAVFNGVLRLADVARPSVTRKRCQTVIVYSADLPSMLVVRTLDEVVDKQGKVFKPLTQWGR
jgi:hypothetical protein